MGFRRRGAGARDAVDYGTPEAARHGDTPKVAEADPDDPNVTVIHRRVMTQREIDRLLRRGRITPRQHQAAERLYADWRASGFEQSGGGFLARLMRVSGGHGSDGAGQAYAQRRLADALGSVGIRLSNLLVEVVLMDRPMTAAHTDDRWRNPPQRYAAAVTDLGHALDMLVKFYGV